MIKKPITAIIMAGGQSLRMAGKDKGLLMLKDKPMFRYLIERLISQVDELMLNANRHQDDYAQAGYRVFTDLIAGYQGPLAGIYSGLFYAKYDWVIFVSCDTPFIPNDLVQKLMQGLGNHKAAYVNDGQRDHPTLLLINKQLQPVLKQYLDEGNRKLQFFLDTVDAVAVDFSDDNDCFININTPEELIYWNQR
ncbi:molybdenum cofactor guanylyltransferase MobA [Utexia brackfieldae]|uniref:molybdenum cofactor guanylyltransferase MobA n=1 Tax=Utexia brackfieldae TaxID=3074108 RepID=UPI00370D5926